MRKVIMLAAMGALLLTLIAGAAVAKSFVCGSNPCTGTNKADQIGERNGGVPDTIRALGKGDSVNAARSSNDPDTVLGQGGNDRLNVADGDTRDNANCGAGRDDTVIADLSEDETLSLDGISECENVLFVDEGVNGASLSSMSDEQLEANTRPATDAEVAAAEAAYDGP